MIIHAPIHVPQIHRGFSLLLNNNKSTTAILKNKANNRPGIGRRSFTNLLAAFAVLASSATTTQPPINNQDTLLNVPQTLSGRECISSSSTNNSKDCKKPRIQRPKSRKAESCTIKCVTTCIRGGDGSPGEGPLNVRRPLVVFKDGFRSRNYCLVECSDICNLIGDGDDGP